ncbi:16S rRNA (adenine(1518)-N(6)/adenine(1519)-N(6))-dimethyltransferase RsmA [Candidatus Anaplasma sp. TIGMIC]|uniref:16S rRNA (adenine(1518)-N(6)/adenine(1519)-N(6))- dimethyltransferase RsmA n=1 Tax=Candidatus Anaplasma sp. TIGMIC TaxID=3020713 RepID=UPI00232E0BF1|nr:16S rRNA (adenine(1518)-N(6)/adenine(1519)-N(6))-dimethyltransferase RsmA [Candidatus Anaplasma sp. TIGMIC]MDB1135709.1 16S rRNA (adenine(1518)-N(6)/adenine(1519)-N(6))-dimethyltransferase RsmA [Candidatus Anaplasma sp. TIGMIC]
MGPGRYRARKSLGQNFILDSAIAEQIVSYAGCLRGCNVIEVGPGLGVMTRSILEKGVHKLTAIEKDKRLVHVHKSLEEEYPEYECMYQDILCTDIESLVAYKPTKMISNLPYNISVILLLKLVQHIHSFEKLVLMFQKEVAERLTANPGQKCYAVLSILIQLFCDVKKVADFPPEVFTPAPKVHSSVVDITPLKTPRFTVDYLYFVQFLKKIFQCKRKTIRNSLRSFTNHWCDVLAACNINPDTRAESLTIEQLCMLSNSLQATKDYTN